MIITVWMFKWFMETIDVGYVYFVVGLCFVVGQVMDVCGRTCWKFLVYEQHSLLI
ncbi:FRIGIDA-like protein 4a [Iris pallida]|uniref:FRIGIDA-like protein 4a n=1 Tax=Iris pallida TaxID=29817 RepID=A0AAX6EBL8_IRIPA|nr:FRIGIDA-like protein 4a [Iris pallida]KAJ6849606.1 FRIGIDA-like protein 4a [Iris pallida]